MLFLALVVGCKTGDDLYLSPNDPAEASLSTLLTAVEVNTMANVEGDLARISSILVQHSVGIGSQYIDIQNYRITQGDFSNSWEGLYSRTMNNANILMDKAGSENAYYAGISKVLMSINIALATDLWGDVPFSESFRLSEGILTPKLDKQEDIYKAIDDMLADAIENFSANESDNIFLPGADDLMYGGDVQKWTKAAYTLRARYLHRTSSKVSGTEARVLDYLNRGISSNDDNLEAVHSTSGGSQNQWEAFAQQRRGYLGANKLFVDFLSSRSDPRISYFLAKNDNDVYLGGNIEDEVINVDASSVGSFFSVGNNYPIVTFYEAKFIEAEVKSKQDLDVSSILNDAIMANVSYVTKGADSGASIADYSNPTLNDVLQEKWVAMYNQSIEAYNDYRRTGFPYLVPRSETVGAELSYTPRRFPFPNSTTLYNPNAKFVPLDVVVWWGNVDVN